MSNQNTVTLEFKKEQIEPVRDVLLANGWRNEEDSNSYVLFRLRSPENSLALMYRSGKLVLQGREEFTSVISNIQEFQGDTVTLDYKPHFGVDEVGKGDYFGPLIVVGCFVTEEFFKRIKVLGFADSKRFTDKKIFNLYSAVKDYPFYYRSIVNPRRYNEMVDKYKNVSILLAKQHALVIEEGLKDLKSKNIQCNYVVIDQFSSSKSRVVNELGEYGRECDLIQRHRGEEDIAVASASIIARGIFIQEWEKMCSKYKLNFPKGASDVISTGREFVSMYGQEKLRDVAKVGFKTTQKIFSLD